MTRSFLLASLSLIVWSDFALAQWGTLQGRVVLDGPLPEIKPLFLKRKASKDNEICGAQDMPDESVVVDSESKGIANVVVWLVKRPKMIHPTLEKPAQAVVEFDQVQCRFKPHILVLRTDQQLKLVSSDGILHNTRPNLVRQQWPFSVVVSTDSRPLTWQPKVAERLPCPICCDIHPWMKAWWMIVDHPYAAVTDKDGKFEIKDLPVGEHEFKVWHENSGFIYKDAQDAKKGMVVRILDGKVTEVPVIQLSPETLLGKK